MSEGVQVLRARAVAFHAGNRGQQRPIAKVMLGCQAVSDAGLRPAGEQPEIGGVNVNGFDDDADERRAVAEPFSRSQSMELLLLLSLTPCIPEGYRGALRT